MTLLFWGPIALLAILALALAGLAARMAFHPAPPASSRRWPERLARALHWSSFLLFLALASGSLDPFGLAFERAGPWPDPLALALGLGLLALGAAALFGPLRSASLGPRLFCGIWLFGCALMGAPLAAEELARACAQSGPASSALGRLGAIDSIEARGAPRLSARFEPASTTPQALPERLRLPPRLAPSLRPGAWACARLSFGSGPFGEPVALRLEPVDGPCGAGA